MAARPIVWRKTGCAKSWLKRMCPIRSGLIEIKTETDAQRWKFPGSPTIRFDGVDPFEQGEAHYGLECRVYLTPDGLRGWPTKDMLREAVNNVARLQGDPWQVHPA